MYLLKRFILYGSFYTILVNAGTARLDWILFFELAKTNSSCFQMLLLPSKCFNSFRHNIDSSTVHWLCTWKLNENNYKKLHEKMSVYNFVLVFVVSLFLQFIEMTNVLWLLSFTLPLLKVVLCIESENDKGFMYSLDKKSSLYNNLILVNFFFQLKLYPFYF